MGILYGLSHFIRSHIFKRDILQICSTGKIKAYRVCQKSDTLLVSEFSTLVSYSYSYSYSYRVTLFNELFSEESCSVIGLSEKMGLQL